MSVHDRIKFFILAALCAPVALTSASVHSAPEATFIVTSTADASDSNTGDGVCLTRLGGCTLRAAIQRANATAGLDHIHFSIPDAGVKTISPTTYLPASTRAVVIDSYTQPGAASNTLTEFSKCRTVKFDA